MNITDVLEHMGYTEDEQDEILDAGFSNGVTWGDAVYTLIGNTFALHLLHQGNAYLDNPLAEDAVTMRYWEVVGQDDYINMETYR
ncbi:MAG: hypothetical protein ACO3FO_06750 [Candidatus Nanopelagicaceae bacterium]